MASEKTPLLADTSDDSTDGSSEPKSTTKTATFSDLFRYATWWDRCLIIVGSLFSAVHGGGWPVLSIVFGEMTDEFVFGPGGTNRTGNESDFVLPNNTLDDYNEKMTRFSLYQVYIGAAVFVASYFQVMCWTTASERQVHKIRLHYFYSILKQEIKWFDQRQSGELTARLAGDIDRIKEGIGDKISFLIQYTAAFFSGFAIGFWKSWKMTLVMMSLTPLLAVCASFLSKLMTSYTKREQDSYAEAGSIAEETLSCIRTVVSFNGQRQERSRYEATLKTSAKLGLWKGTLQGGMLGFTMLVMFGTYALAFWYGTEQVKEWFDSNQESGISPGEVLTVFFCVMIGSFSLGNAAPAIGSVFTAKGAASTLIETIDNEPSIDATSSSGRKLQEIEGHIELENVDFSYPAKDKRPELPVLKKMNFHVQPGQTVALVGPSGCGKSTVMSLIQRLYDPSSGQVLLDGVNVKDLNVCWLRRNVGVVSQEPVLFGYTIAENIRLGNPDATMQEIEKAAKEANAHDFISTLPKGYNTLVGERGAQLSGGQKQRVAIARALVRDPRIILLDEATSALDTESEKVVQAALDRARIGRTTIVIAHRLSTIQNSDVIFVVDQGKIYEKGTHAELMKKQELYYELVMAQSLAEDNEEGLEEEEEEEAAEGEKDDEASDIDAAKARAKILRSRSRVSSSEGKERKLSKQLSRQFSRQYSKLSEKGGVVVPDQTEEKLEEEEFEQPKYFRMLKANSPECGFIIMGVLASAIAGCIMPAFALFFGEMIKVFVNRGKDSLLWSMMFLALGGANFLTQFIQSAAFSQSGERLTMRLRIKVFTSMLRQDVAYFDDPKHSTGALTTRLATDASLIKNATGIRIAIVLQSLVSLVAALVIAFIYGWQLALVVMGGIPIVGAAGFLQLKVVTGQHKKDVSSLENAGKIASESIENIRTVQSLSREEYFFEAYRKSLMFPLRTALKQAQLYGLAFGFSSGVIFMIYGGCFRFGAYMVSLGNMDPDEVYKVFFAITFTGLVIGQSSSFLPDYAKAKHAAGLVFKIIDTVPPIDVYSPRGVYQDKVNGKIRFSNVNFNYPSRSEVTVLKNLNFEVEPGQTVALVGSSGCGKSTVISLLQRFYDPQEGEITIDGIDVKQLNLARWRSFIGVVSQEPILFDCSFRDNIAYGLDRMVGMDEIIEAARSANIHDFITSLPAGYDTKVGEKGTQLSGGQKQRVAIARAIIRNPSILLLDEATSALDTESEKVVQAALDSVLEGRTCLVIAHRLSTIQNADVIFVMDSGQIVEKGTHHELISKKGVYSALVHAQQLSV